MQSESKKYKQLKDRFRQHRNRKPDDPLSKAFKAKGTNIKPEELDALLAKFLAESKAKESVTTAVTEVDANVEREGEVRKTYPELLDHYKVNDDEAGHEKLDTYFKMSYYRKVKVPKKQSKTAVELKLTDGFKFVYFVKAGGAINTPIPISRAGPGPATLVSSSRVALATREDYTNVYLPWSIGVAM